MNLTRLFKPKTIAVIGGGEWCTSIMSAAHQIGYEGTILPIHPSGKEIAGVKSLKSLDAFPGLIDAAFIGVNRHATLDIVSKLSTLKAGGATCFASGFSEAAAEDAIGANLQKKLVEAAGDMPILGPNCYGFLNAFDKCSIWPDQHGCREVDRGVAVLTQSSNIAINITMQNRGLPIGYMITCGNQAQTSQADVALHLLDDPRITSIGLHIEGFGNLRNWEKLAHKAHQKNIPIIVLKSGKSQQAKSAAISHTATITGSDVGAQAFLDRLGIRRAESLPVFLEVLKLNHQFGTLESNQIASISCSGGEAALAADAVYGTSLEFPPLTTRQRRDLRKVLGPMVALANPLDYHTYIWRDEPKMAAAWAAMANSEIALTLIISDYPRSDICDQKDWNCVTGAAISAAKQPGRPYAVVASLGELMPEDVAKKLMRNGVAAVNGLDHCIQALNILIKNLPRDEAPLTLPGPERTCYILDEYSAKQELASFGISIPHGNVISDRENAAQKAIELGFPIAVKIMGLTHKTGSNGLALGLNSPNEVQKIIPILASGDVLIEQMIVGNIAELLVGVIRDKAHGFVMTLAAGGTTTELLGDSTSLLLPAKRSNVTTALNSLKMAPLLHGYRDKKSVNFDAILDAIEGIQAYVLANVDSLEEIEINPLICTAEAAIAADALIRKAR